MEDDEAEDYLYSKKEAAVKEQLWLAMNSEYVEKQEAKRLTQASKVCRPVLLCRYWHLSCLGRLLLAPAAVLALVVNESVKLVVCMPTTAVDCFNQSALW